MVDLVDVLVQRAPVQRSMRPVVPCVLDNKEDGELVGHCEERWEWDGSAESDVDGHGMEEPNDISYDRENRSW